MKLPATIEAVLFYKGEPVTIRYLAKLLGKNEDEIRLALGELEIDLKERGLILVMSQNEVSLGTAPELGPIMEKIHGGEREYEEPSKAALETLSVILYRGPISKTDIDYLRGVNSYFTLRHLMIRGLIEKSSNQDDDGGYHYKPTLDLLATLGISKNNELPNYSSLNEAFK